MNLSKKMLSVLAPTATAAAAAVAAGPAMAGLTPIVESSTEATHLDIFNATYGGGFSASGAGFVSSDVTVERVDDAEDISFGFGSFTAQSIARFASLDQSFGYVDAEGDFQMLFEETGSGFDVTGSVGETTLDTPVTFARLGTGGVVSSDPTANSDGEDHLITYKVTSGSDEFYVLFFEDLFGSAADNDFQDLVVEVRAISAVPTPAAAGLGLVLMGGLAFRRRRDGV
ncbi:MAG: DUF4114 domain-containing protein [Planctomycetota bacterium]